MAKIIKQSIGLNGEVYHWVFYCPGCGCQHAITTEHQNSFGAIWDFNGDVEKPTFNPSLLVRWYHGEKKFQCHSFIREGRIQFLSDCTHELAGKTVEIIDIK